MAAVDGVHMVFENKPRYTIFLSIIIIKKFTILYIVVMKLFHNIEVQFFVQLNIFILFKDNTFN